MKGGVLIIGSLLWQEGSTKQPWDGARQYWRDHYLDMGARRAVRAPIRYGGYSAWREVPVRFEQPEPSTGWPLETNIVRETDAHGAVRHYLKPRFEAGVYTMTFSSACDTPGQYGTAWFCPLRASVETLDDVLAQVKALAKAEGIFYSDQTYFNKPWGAVTAQLNPDCPLAGALTAKWQERTAARDRSERRKWEDVHGSSTDYVPYPEQFRLGDDPVSCLTSDGLLNLQELRTTDGQRLLTDLKYDFVLTTVTLPRLAPGAPPNVYPTAAEIGGKAQVDPRRYFRQNYAHGITTFQDDAIWQRIGFRSAADPSLSPA